MTLNKLTDTGSNRLRYRLMIEGWPDEWVTDATITHSGNADGRNVYPGLQHTGLAISDRIIMQDAKVQADGITFSIVSPTRSDEAMRSFSLFPSPSAQLTTGLNDSDTSPFDVNPSGVLVNGTVYHLGTEAVRYNSGGGGSIDRHIWDTQAQAHKIVGGLGVADDPARAIYVYTKPPTMTGRRVKLFVYTKDDAGSGDGTCIWRGFVGAPPSLAADCVTWQIYANPVTQIMQQSVAGSIKEAHIAGIYHSSQCCVYIAGKYGDSPQVEYKVPAFTNASTLCQIVSDQFSSMLTALSATTIDYVRLEQTQSGFQLNMKTNNSATVPKFAFFVSSLLIGQNSSEQWVEGDGTMHPSTFLLVEIGAATNPQNTSLTSELSAVGTNSNLTGFMACKDAPYAALGNAAAAMQGSAPIAPGLSLTVNGERWHDAADAATAPQWRLILDQDLTGAEAVHISGTYKPGGMFGCTAGLDSGFIPYIDVDPWTANPFTNQAVGNSEEKQAAIYGFLGFLGADCTISALRNYGVGISVANFIQALKDQGVNANDGDTPFVTEADFSDWELGAIASDPTQQQRVYQFFKPTQLETLLAEELKYANHFPRLEIDGRIGLAPLPAFSDATPVTADHVLDGDVIITPAGSFGAWPGWEPQRDGLITTVEIDFGYDPLDESWKGKPGIYQNSDAVATHKTRGQVQATIKPYTHALREPTSAGGVNSAFYQIAANFLNTFSRDYAVVKIQVSFKAFNIVCGDLVQITHRLVPAGDGTRGIVARRGVCIQRRWNLDPSLEEWGTLWILLYADVVRGYAPSAHITAESTPDELSPNVWAITCSAADSLNIAWSSTGDGKVLEHFHVGDYVRVVAMDDLTSPEQTGTITAVNSGAGTCTVSFDGTWSVGVSEWVLEYQYDDTGSKATVPQRKFVYVADGTLARPDTHFADRLN